MEEKNKCSKCGKVHSNRDSIFLTEDNELVCEECATKYYKQCRRCSRLIKKECTRNQCKVCQRYYYTAIKNEYSAKPHPIFFGNKGYDNDNCGRYFGLEIEYNNLRPELTKTLFRELYDDYRIYNKHDGSIAKGVEIVTNPMVKSEIFKTLDLMEEGLKTSKNIRNKFDNAGIHIHVNRKSIDPLTIYKLSYMLNYNISEYEKLLLNYISGRSKKANNKNPHCNYSQLGSYSSIDFDKIKENDSRYVALNLRNFNTIEFRIFKSTDNVNIIKEYVNIVDYMIEYASEFGFSKMNILLFVKWVIDKYNNKYVIDKLDKFKRFNTTPEIKDNIYSIPIDNIKGIKVEDWGDMIDDLSYVNSTKEYARVISYYKQRATKRKMYHIDADRYITAKKYGDSRFMKKLKRTYEIVMKHKIMKEIKRMKEVTQCA